MSIVGVSSYFLWTQKGKTVLPLVRGSGFIVPFQRINCFHKYHILSAAHVTCPVRHRNIYGNTVGLHAIGERHISNRLLKPNTGGAIETSIEMEFSQTFLPSVDVASLKCRNEGQVEDTNLQPFDLDLTPLENGTKLHFCGVEAVEERGNPNDDGLSLKEIRVEGECKAALVSIDYGTVILASLASPLLLSMCGGPVLRRDSGKCVGVIVARALKNAPPRDPNVGVLYQDPWLDISQNESLHSQGGVDVAFVPIREFIDPLRRSEK